MKSLKEKLLVVLRRLYASFNKYPFIYTVVGLVLYLLIFQFKFVVYGDNWAEAFYEYVHNVVVTGSSEFLKTGIAGYYNFIPKLLSYGYIHLHLPIGYIDHFFRISVIAFTILCVGFIAHSYNKHLIKNNIIRSAFALLVLMIFYHVSSFSFINVWYVGFIPIILVSLKNERIKNELAQVAYAGFAMAVCLTKPSLILLPFVIYRMIRLKEWLLGSIIIFSIGLQSALFFTSAFYHQYSSLSVHTSILDQAVNVCLYAGISILKLLQIAPSHLIIVVLSVIMLLIFIFITFKARGFIQTAVIGIVFLLSIYTAIYAPDAPPVNVINDYKSLYSDIFKLQREVVIDFFILLFFFISAGYVMKYISHIKKQTRPYIYLTLSILVLGLALAVYRPIDTQSSNIYINIDAFRQSLSERDPICMPIPITPSWVPNQTTYAWYYESRAYGSCTKQNYEKQIDYSSFTNAIKKGQEFTINGDGSRKINALLIPISNPAINKATIVQIKNINTDKVYSSKIEAKNSKDHLSFVAFNLASEPLADSYTYIISESGNAVSSLETGTFTDTSLAIYPYFYYPINPSL